jgi:hypothetical protein
MDKALCAYLWDDAPAALREAIVTTHPPHLVWVVPARWLARTRPGLLPPALTALLEGYAGAYWGHVERFHQPDGTLLIACSRLP